MQNTLVKIPIVLVIDWPGPLWSNLTRNKNIIMPGLPTRVNTQPIEQMAMSELHLPRLLHGPDYF